MFVGNDFQEIVYRKTIRKCDDISTTIELNGNVLTISSERNDQKEVTEEERYFRKEFSYQSFRRTFTLQKDVVDIDRIEARYENGLLQLFCRQRIGEQHGGWPLTCFNF